MKNIAYQANALNFSYEGTPVLSNISFIIQKGERVAILGANGSGKSTLLKLLSALQFAASGRLAYCGKNLSAEYFQNEEHEYAFRKEVGFVFQDPDVQLFNQTVWDEVIFGPFQMGLTVEEVKKRAEWAMEITGVMHLRDRSPFTLSGGEKKRVALASILSMRPKVWLMDEPLASLDPKSQSRLIDFINDAHKRGETIIMTTHDLSLLDEMADRVLVLSESHELVADTTVTKILKERAFLIHHNLMHNHIHTHHGRLHEHTHMHVLEHTHNS